MPGTPNFPNRILYHGDNLDFLRGMNSETVHLIATDPPFNKNKDFHATPDSLSAGAKFDDRWSWRKHLHDDWVNSISNDYPEVWQVIMAAKNVWGNDMGAFLCWMGVRLLEMHRILRNDGSLYLHIDHSAHAWTKCLLDAIFGRRNFRNEIVWCYSGGGIPKKDYPRKHDSILRYTKSRASRDWTFNVERKPYKENTQQVGIHSTYSGPDNEIDLARGTPVTDWWTDIPTVTGWNPEDIGYPTQKPLGLLERIIKASSKPGDIVLDPFCGCATTPIAAERLGRQWVGMDIWDRAHKIVLKRLAEEKLAVPDDDDEAAGNPHLLTFGRVSYTTTPPERTDGRETAALPLATPSRGRGQSYPAPRSQHAQLLADVGAFCQGCGQDYSFDPRVLEVDHRQPKADGGTDAYENLTLLCPPCNKEKRDRLTLTGLQEFNRKNGYLKEGNEANIRHGRAGGQGARRRRK